MSSYNPNETTLTADNVATLQPAWTAPVLLVSAPVVSGTRAFALTTDGQTKSVTALSMVTGEQQWSVPLAQPVSAYVDPITCLDPDGANRLHVTDPSTQADRWTFTLPEPSAGPTAPTQPIISNLRAADGRRWGRVRGGPNGPSSSILARVLYAESVARATDSA
jgi:hypothetical protein